VQRVRHIVSVHQLLELHDAEFVDAAHHALLGRAPERGTRDGYIQVLRDGHDKDAVLYQLAISEEAKRHANDLRDLPAFLHLQHRLRSRPFGPILKLVYLLRKHRMQLNRIENALGRLQSRGPSSGQSDYSDAGYKSITSPRARMIFRRLRRA
jgi:hypothetical protein